MPNNRNHIDPQRIWAYLHAGGELTSAEHPHIAACVYCFELFLLCVKADTLASALDAFADGTDDRRSA